VERAAAEELVDRLLADPPVVHAMDLTTEPELGVWSTDRDCYVFIAEHVAPGARTLETGSGLSTVLFTALGAHHTAVTPAQHEAERIVSYCRDHGIDAGNLRFEIGFSEEVLPSLDREEQFDLVMVDGNHGFPTPILDWYFAGSRLRPSGRLIMDDVSLPAVAHLCAFMDRDPRWSADRHAGKWNAYRRLSEGDLRQDWFEQPFYGRPVTGLRDLVGRAPGHVRRTLASGLRSRVRWPGRAEAESA
jgi:hypothetical protein